MTRLEPEVQRGGRAGGPDLRNGCGSGRDNQARAVGRSARVRARAKLGAGPAALLSAITAWGCDHVKQDKFSYQGGISPDATAVLEGTVAYIGPRPACKYDAERNEQRVVGRVFLTLFEYDNPPPPEGTATSAVNLLAISGSQLFSLSDCLPAGVQASESESLTRSVAFRWPGVTLHLSRAVDYQVRGFYDYDEDMLALFSVTRLPTAGDIVGAALNDVQDPSKGFLRIQLPKLEDAEDGVVKSAITVALGNATWTELPAFRLDENRKLAADSAFAPAIRVVNGAITADGPGSLRIFRALTCASGGSDGTSCGLTLQRFGLDVLPQLQAGGVQLEVNDPSSYAFYAEPVDVTTVVPLGGDHTGADGKVDPHPFLGSGLDVDWYTPMVIMQRFVSDAQQAAVEAAARIPAVLMVGSVLLDDAGQPTKSSYLSAPIAMAPVAAVELIANHSECRVPYFAPGTANLVTDDRVAHCGELPTGYYAVNVFGGIAGGTRSAASNYPVSSDSPVAIKGGLYSGQSWSVPNELADSDQVEPANVLPDQGIAGAFIVHDPSPGQAACTPSSLRGICEAELQFGEDTRGEGIDSPACLPRSCCEAILHLCGVPRCALTSRPADGNVVISESPTAVVGTAANGAAIPNCIPFELPSQCAALCPGS